MRNGKDFIGVNLRRAGYSQGIMSVLSNIRRPDDGMGSAIVCGPAASEQIEPALRLMLAGAGSYASQEQVVDFLTFAAERNIDVNGIWIAQSEGRILWMLLP